MIQKDKRYKELKEIIKNHQLDKIGKFRDYPIIATTDLIELLTNTYYELKTFKEKDKLVDILTELYSVEEYNNNKELIEQYAKDTMKYEGEIYDIPSLLKLGLDDITELTFYPLTLVRDPHFEIKQLPQAFLNNKFIELCFKCNNLSIINHIEFDSKYLEEAKRIVSLGYGCELQFCIDDRYKKELIKPLIENGYLNNFDIVTDDLFTEEERKELLNIVKEKLKTGAVYKNPSAKINDLELATILIEQNNLDAIICFPKDIYNEVEPLIIKKLKEGVKLDFGPITLTDNIIETLLNNNNLECINYMTYAKIAKYQDLIITKLNENHEFSLAETYTYKYYYEDFIELVKNKKLLEAISKNNVESLLKITNCINHDENLSYLYNKDFYEATRETLSNYYNVNLNNLDVFVNRFGYETLHYLENINLQNTIDLIEDSFQKYLSIFQVEDLTMTDIYNIYDSILQTRFLFEHKDDVDRLTRIKNSLDNEIIPEHDLAVLATLPKGDIEKIFKLSSNNDVNLNSKEEKNNFKITAEDYNLCKKDLLEFLNIIATRIKNQEQVTYNMTILYNINHQYLKNLREQYRTNFNMFDELNLDKAIDESEYLYQLENYLEKLENPLYFLRKIIKPNVDLEKIETEFSCFKSTPQHNNKMKKTLILITAKNEGNYNRDLFTKNDYKNIKEIKRLLRYLITNDMLVEKTNEYLKKNILQNKENPKMKYLIPTDNHFVLGVIQEINPNILEKEIFNNPKIYNELLDLMQKYKFINWNNIFKPALTNSNLTFENYDLSSLINKFREVSNYYEEKLKNQTEENTNVMSLPDYIKFSNVLSSNSSYYDIILNKETTLLLKLNPGTNKAIVYDINERLDLGVYYLMKTYEKNYITTPTIDEDIIVDDKLINVNLGNFTNPINLIYGEMSDSCMRIKGQGEDLLYFSYLNEHAFHIRLTNPKTCKLISRVTGFRNGNSIFLNELRHSLDEENYPDELLTKALKQIADHLINMTKDSKSPIENVFITRDYAMENYPKKEVLIKEDIKAGLPKFYFDLKSEAIVLATTSKDGAYVSINTDKNNLEKYRTLRDKVNEHTESIDIINQLNRINLLKETFTTGDYEKYKTTSLIPNNKIDDYLYAISGEDFIVYLGSDLNIYTNNLPRQDERMFKEIEQAKLFITNKFSLFDNSIKKR